MSRRWRNGGQAMLELAVFGSLMLLCLSYLVRYGQMFIYQQMVEQEAMRRAEAEGKNNGPLHTGSAVVLRDKRMVEPSNPFVTGPRQLVASSASVSMSNELLVNAPAAPFQVDSGNLMHPVPNQIPVNRIMMNSSAGNEQVVTLRLADYRDIFGAPLRHICRYTDVYGQAAVAVINPVQDPDPNYHDDDFLRYQCASKFSEAKIKHDPTPPGVDSYSLRILDSCLGDLADPTACHRQCDDMCGLDLPLPTYCGAPIGGCDCHLESCRWSGIPDEKAIMGLDLQHTTRTRTINHDERVRSENLSAHQSSTHIDESEHYSRPIRTSPISEGPSPFDTDGDGTITVDQTVNTQRDESFSTPW